MMALPPSEPSGRSGGREVRQCFDYRFHRVEMSFLQAPVQLRHLITSFLCYLNSDARSYPFALLTHCYYDANSLFASPDISLRFSGSMPMLAFTILMISLFGFQWTHEMCKSLLCLLRQLVVFCYAQCKHTLPGLHKVCSKPVHTDVKPLRPAANYVDLL